MKKLTLLLLVMLSVATLGTAQKYAHLNLGNLISSLAETKAADQQLADYAEQLKTDGEAMANKFKADYLDLLKEINAGSISPVQQAEKEKTLQAEQTKIQAYELEAQQRVNAKREEVLRPILAKVEAAIETIAKEEGYTMVFDTSVFNAILHVNEADNLMEKVKAKLGVE